MDFVDRLLEEPEQVFRVGLREEARKHLVEVYRCPLSLFTDLEFDELVEEGLDCEQLWMQVDERNKTVVSLAAMAEKEALLSEDSPADFSASTEEAGQGEVGDENEDEGEGESEDEYEYENEDKKSDVFPHEHVEEDEEQLGEEDSLLDDKGLYDGFGEVEMDANGNLIDEEDEEQGFGEEEGEDLDEMEDVEVENVETEQIDDEIDVDRKRPLSSFEKERLKLQQQTEELESQVLSKPWQMLGEATAKKRPLNSLLEQPLDFEQPITTVPVITEEVTDTLEDRIKKRILESMFDDVERKSVTETKKRQEQVELNMEKSKQSLADVYEAEFQQKAADVAPTLVDRHNQEQLKSEITNLFRRLVFKLDRLANFQYSGSSDGLVEEVQVVSNLPALMVEEMIPSAMNEENRLAPQEIYASVNPKGASGVLKGDSEKNQTDRKRAYRQKKLQLKKKKAATPINDKAKALKALQAHKNVKIVKGGDKKTKEKGKKRENKNFRK